MSEWAEKFMLKLADEISVAIGGEVDSDEACVTMDVLKRDLLPLLEAGEKMRDGAEWGLREAWDAAKAKALEGL